MYFSEFQVVIDSINLINKNGKKDFLAALLINIYFAMILPAFKNIFLKVRPVLEHGFSNNYFGINIQFSIFKIFNLLLSIEITHVNIFEFAICPAESQIFTIWPFQK